MDYQQLPRGPKRRASQSRWSKAQLLLGNGGQSKSLRKQAEARAAVRKSVVYKMLSPDYDIWYTQCYQAALLSAIVGSVILFILSTVSFGKHLAKLFAVVDTVNAVFFLCDYLLLSHSTS